MVSVAIWLVSCGRNFTHALPVFADLGAENGFNPDECEPCNACWASLAPGFAPARRPESHIPWWSIPSGTSAGGTTSVFWSIGDLLTGANDTHIATLVERNTRFTMLIKIPRKDTTTVVAALAKHISKLPEELRRSLTWDQGKEMHAHKRFTVATNVQVYFCDPRSPWQRGSNENTNGLLRQYLPRGTDFSRISQSYLNAIALRLNQRPRKTLGFQTPADRLQAVLH